MRNKLKKPLKKRQNSEYWIYGHHAVVAALKNEKREKYEIVFTTEAKKKLEKEINLQELKLIKKIKNRDEIENLLGEKSNHQGICLKANKIANQELKELISNIKSDNALIVLLDQLEDPQNVGAIFRSALAFNLNGVIMTENNSVNENWPSPFTKKSIDYVLSTTKEHSNEWVTVKANVKEDFKKLHNLDVNELNGVAIMTDTDNSKLKAISYYQNIYFSSK